MSNLADKARKLYGKNGPVLLEVGAAYPEPAMFNQGEVDIQDLYKRRKMNEMIVLEGKEKVAVKFTEKGYNDYELMKRNLENM